MVPKLRPPEWLLIGAFALGLIALVVLAAVPLGQSTSIVTDTAGRAQAVHRRTTAIDTEGRHVVLLLAAPLVPVLAAMATLRRPNHPRIWLGCGAVLAVFCFVTGFSIGLFYLPSCLALLGAAAWSANSPLAP